MSDNTEESIQEQEQKQEQEQMICPILKPAKTMNEVEQQTFLENPNLVVLFETECSKDDNTTSNEWRERLIVYLFNLSENPYPTNKLYTHYFNKMNELKQFIHTHENISEFEIKEENLVQKAGMGFNYDFEYTVTYVENGVDNTLKRKYEYKHHGFDKLPQFLSLYDSNNPVTNEKGPKEGQWKTKYTCKTETYYNENTIKNKKGKPVEFWPNNPYWKYHFEHGIPLIRKVIPDLPVISERAYFCAVKQLIVPGVSILFPKDKIYSLDELILLLVNDAEIQRIVTKFNENEDIVDDEEDQDEDDDDDDEVEEIVETGKKPKEKKKKKKQIITLAKFKVKIADHIKAYNSWNGSLKDATENELPSDIINFFHLLKKNQNNPAIKDVIQGKTTISKYLQLFMAESKDIESLITEVRNRQENKRFMFFDIKDKYWYLGFFKDNFEFSKDHTTIESDDISRIYLKTNQNNFIEFNLRWANSKGIQNTAWQVNLKQENKKTKLEFDLLGIGSIHTSTAKVAANAATDTTEGKTESSEEIAALMKLSSVALKDMCESEGVAKSGAKKVLCERLIKKKNSVDNASPGTKKKGGKKKTSTRRKYKNKTKKGRQKKTKKI